MYHQQLQIQEKNNMVNEFIQTLSSIERQDFYIAFGQLMYVIMFFLFIWGTKKFNIKRKNLILLFISFATAFLLSPIICSSMNHITSGLIPKRNLGVGFLPFIVLFSLLSYIFKISFFESLDVVVPMYIGGRGVCIIGCLFTGCCHGFPVEWGIYSHHAACNTVPCPLFDSIASILIVILLMKYCKNKENYRVGKTAAYGMVTFGILRYVIDILRDNNKLLSMLTFEGIIGFITMCVGLILLYYLENITQKNTSLHYI